MSRACGPWLRQAPARTSLGGALRGPREDDDLGWKIRAGCVAGIQPYRLGVLRVAAPPGQVLIGAVRQLLAYDPGDLAEGHLDPFTACRAKMPLQAFILLAPHHENIMLGPA